MSLFTTLFVVAVVIFSFVTLLFGVSILIKRNDIADIAWGPGIGLATLTAWWSNGFDTSLSTLVVISLIAIWSIRLGVRNYFKNRNKPEDVRYQRWRESWGKWFYIRSYLQVFLLQGALMIVLATSGIVAAHTLAFEPPLHILAVGVLIWCIGFFFEAVGDYQLDRFIANPENKGRLMRYGLWRYSRHPNYFGEVTMWWGIWLIVAPLPLGLFALLSPITITILILYVSGIPLLESVMQKYDEWPEYKRTTSIFFPLPPKTE